MYAVCFVFDHDEAGIQGQQDIRQHGYEPDFHSLTLTRSTILGAVPKNKS